MGAPPPRRLAGRSTRCPDRPKEKPFEYIQSARMRRSPVYTIRMDIEFDLAKDAANIAKHGVSMARAIELDGIVFVTDERFAEPRFRLYGTIDGVAHCAAVAMRGSVVRIINLRRAHAKEMRRYGL